MEEAENVDVGSLRYCEVPQKGGGKGILCTGGSNLTLVSRETALVRGLVEEG